MWKKLYSNSGLILLAILAAGVWFSNLQSLFPAKNAPKYSDFDAPTSPTQGKSAEEIPGLQPTPRRSAEEILGIAPSPALTPVPFDEFTKRFRLRPTAICADGTYSYRASKRGPCAHHGGVAQWISR